MSRCAQINLVPQTVDLALYAGDGASLKLVVANVNGEPIPIDGLVTAQIRVSKTDPTIAASWTTDIVDGAQGIIYLSLSGVQTAALVNGSPFAGVWDVEWDSTDQEPVTLLQGKVTCDQDVTRA
jgi:hypothetical protein